jgi:hypothetical protein
MDLVDNAQLLTELNLQQSLASRKTITLADTGKCHNCEEPIQEGHFCDSDCRDDHEQLNRK